MDQNAVYRQNSRAELFQFELFWKKIRENLPEHRLEHHEFKVYSQNGEDGIIAEIFERIGTTNRSFVEFGVGNGAENNTVFLLGQGWNGLWIEGNQRDYGLINTFFTHYISEKKLHVRNSFITRENINDLISAFYTGGIDLLSIDIDRNDYYVWEAIECIQPRVVVAEYNAKFPPQINWRVPYEPDSVWDGTDYFGMSLLAASELGKRKGYVLVGTEITGTNCFFVREDVLENAKEQFSYPMSVKDLFNPARYLADVSRPTGHRLSGRFPLLLPLP